MSKHNNTSNNRWRLNREVRELNPDNGEATQHAITLRRIIMGRSNITPEPGAKVLQKETRGKGKKIRGEVMVTNPNKRKITSNENKPRRKQVDMFIMAVYYSQI